MLAEVTQTGGLMQCYLKSFTLETTKAPEYVDITDEVTRVVSDSEIRNGLVLVFSQHTTAAIVVNENEPFLLEDAPKFLEKLAPQNGTYKHNDLENRTVNMCEDECANGHAHLQHMVLGTSQIVPLQEGKIPFGQWQRIFLVELDRPRSRTFLVQVLGTA